jgi:DNA gyrase/topoisomerase IV subunit A
MDDDERERVESQLRVYDLLLEAIERRQEVVDLVWSAETPAEAAERMQSLFRVSEPHLSQAVLDMQVRVWTRSERERLLESATQLRRALAAPD